MEEEEGVNKEDEEEKLMIKAGSFEASEGENDFSRDPDD